MSDWNSYISDHRLPDNRYYRVIHDIILLLNTLFFIFNYVIIYISPPTKERSGYKALVHMQMISVFLFSVVWAGLMKMVPHFNLSFFYCEGYFYMIRLSCGLSYSLVCITYGCFASSSIACFIYRLYLLVDHSHYLRASKVLIIIFIVLLLTYSVLPCIGFQARYGNFSTTLLQLNLTKEQITYFTLKSICIFDVRILFHTLYLCYILFIIALALVIIIPVVAETVRIIHRKQNVMSVGTTKHHLRVLKSLSIQVAVNAIISCCIPAIIAMTFFMQINSYFLCTLMFIVGTNSTFQSILSVYTNPASLKTLMELSKFRVPGSGLVITFPITKRLLRIIH